MMKSALNKVFGVLGLAVAGTCSSFSQGWFFQCIDPMNMMPYSLDYGLQGQQNDLIIVRMGVSGTVTWGGPNGPCFSPAVTLNVRGRFAFGSGVEGSVQSSFDD